MGLLYVARMARLDLFRAMCKLQASLLYHEMGFPRVTRGWCFANPIGGT